MFDLRYGVLSLCGYGVMGLQSFVFIYEVQARIRRIFLMERHIDVKPIDRINDAIKVTLFDVIKDEQDDKSINIQETDDERTEFDNNDVAMADATKTNTDKAEEEENVEKAEEENKEEELKGDDQAKNEQEVDPVFVTHKDKPDLLLSTSSHSVSSNFGNQFLNISPNASLIGTIYEKADAEITSLMDIEIQHAVPNIQQDPLHEVPVSVLSNPTTRTTTPPPITPPLVTTTEAPIPPTLQFETLTSALQRLSAIEQEQESQKDASQIIKVKKEDAAKEKWSKYLTSPFDQADEDDMEKAKAAERPTQKKRRHKDKDQDLPAGSDQGTKKGKKTKDAELSKRPKSTSSSKGTTQSKPKSTGKSVQAEETVLEAADTDIPFNQ
ncbi:hypothetical protein Tco_0295775 [Tanacetum coccineum]